MGCGSSTSGGSVNRVHPTTYKGPRCTFTTTGRHFTPQKVFICHTCKLSDDAVLCENCLISCHANCRTSEKGTVMAYCNCGMRGQTQCICVAALSPAGEGEAAVTSSSKPAVAPSSTTSALPTVATAPPPVTSAPEPVASTPGTQTQTSDPPYLLKDTSSLES